MSELQLEWRNPDQANASLRGQLIPYCKPILDAGDGVAIVAMPLKDARSLKQNRYYWKAVLTPISDQARLDGIGATTDGWHLYYKRMYLGYEFKKTYVPGNKRVSIIRELRSTTKLSVRNMAVYLTKVQAHATTVFGVQFPLLNWEQWTGQDIDPETGEIRH